MNLLLLLSALLSALSGVGGSVRPPQAMQSVAQQARVAAARTIVRAAPASRPVVALPSARDVVVALLAPAWRLTASEPLYASRRRE